MSVQEDPNIPLPQDPEITVGPAQEPPRPTIFREALSPQSLALLIPASILGTLARLGLQALTSYAGSSIFPLAYPQALGCLIMGLCVGLKSPLARFYKPLYTVLTTGFCGSLTTFSGWQMDVFQSWLNIHHVDRGRLHDFIDGVAKTAFTLSLSIVSLIFGLLLSKHTAWNHIPQLRPPGRYLGSLLIIVSILTYAATIPTYLLLSPSFRHQATSAILFAYPGALSRHLLIVALNPLSKSIPLGTLASNLIGTALLAIFYVLQHLTYHPVASNACDILQGLSDGYCGCLSTISTFAAEIYTLGGRKGGWYVFLSWCLGQLLLLFILGLSLQTGQASEEMTCSFN